LARSESFQATISSDIVKSFLSSRRESISPEVARKIKKKLGVIVIRESDLHIIANAREIMKSYKFL